MCNSDRWRSNCQLYYLGWRTWVSFASLHPQSWLTLPWIRLTHLGTGTGPARCRLALPSSLPSRVSWPDCTLCDSVGGPGPCCLLFLLIHLSDQALLLQEPVGIRGSLINLHPPETGGHLPWPQPLCPQNVWFRSHFKIYIPSACKIP